MKNENICAGIVTYNPDINLLVNNIQAIYQQVSDVIIVDNGSVNIEEIKDICCKLQIKLIENGKNIGIAAALNKIMKNAADNGKKWCVTLDQDSVCPPNLILEATDLLDKDNIAEICPSIFEVNTGEKPSLDAKPNGSRYQVVPKCITSSTITNVEVWKSIGGFDDQLFIDYVDYDYSLKARTHGYQIIRMNNIYFNQQLGESKYHKLLFLKVRVANHSAFRKYYICRNIIIFIKRYSKSINTAKEILRILKTLGLTILYEDNKKDKIHACFRGIHDGLTWKN